MIAPEKMTREELEEEVTQLRLDLAVAVRETDVDRLVAVLPIKRPRSIAELLLALHGAGGRTVPKWSLEELTRRRDRNYERGEKIVDVTVCQARKVIGRASIRTVRGIGFAITSEGIEHIDALLKGPAI